MNAPTKLEHCMPKIYIRTFTTESATIAANTRKQELSFANYSTQSGYNLITYRQTNGSTVDIRNNVFLQSINASSGKAYVENTGSSSTTGTITVAFYYVKSEDFESL